MRDLLGREPTLPPLVHSNCVCFAVDLLLGAVLDRVRLISGGSAGGAPVLTQDGATAVPPLVL